MDRSLQDLDSRISAFERRLQRQRLATIGLAVVILAAVVAACATSTLTDTHDLVRARRIEIIDDRDRLRILLGQDEPDTQRISRSAGLWLLDAEGTERFGVVTMENASVTMGLDAPNGVGDAMGDRMALSVQADGTAGIMLINNETGVPVRLITNDDGSGGIEFIDYDMERGVAIVKRLDFSGEAVRELPMN